MLGLLSSCGEGCVFTVEFQLAAPARPILGFAHALFRAVEQVNLVQSGTLAQLHDLDTQMPHADLVDCIIAMPTQLFYTTQIPVSLWFISKRKKQAGKTLFIDARKMGDMVSRKLRELTDEDIKKIADTYNVYVNGTLEDVKGFCAVVDTEKIAEQDYILTPGRYVGVEEQEDNGEPFEEKMVRLTSELSDLFKQSHKLEAEIKEKLGAIGYEI